MTTESKVIVTGMTVNEEEVTLPIGLASLLEDPNLWGPEQYKELPGYESDTFFREGKRVTRIKETIIQKKYA